jgi:hypothetical protein
MSLDADRFVSNWIKSNQFSKEALDVLLKGKEIYQHFYSNLNLLPINKFKIETWDAGWYQIRRCLTENGMAIDLLNELKNLNNILAMKINSKIEYYGFLDKDEIFENTLI